VGDLLPGESLIYEHATGITYARYRDPPHNTIPRWIIGGDTDAIARAKGQFISGSDFQDICKLSLTNVAIKEILDQLIVVYTLVKEDK